MLEKPIKKPITADPSKFSLREEVLSIESKGVERVFSMRTGVTGRENVIYIDDETGEKFHKIDPKLATSQKLLSLILKGVINVSDVVKVGDDYYSHEQNFDHIEPGKEDIIAEVTADIFIIKRVFGDRDHEYYLKNDPDRAEIEKKYPNSVLQHHNLRFDETNKKLNFFDFETYGNDWVDKIKNLKNVKKTFKSELVNNSNLPINTTILGILKNIKKIFKSGLINNSDLPMNTIVLRILENKVVKLIANLFTSDKFDIFKKIVERSEIKLTENEQRILFNNIALRLQILKKELSKIKKKQ